MNYEDELKKLIENPPTEMELSHLQESRYDCHNCPARHFCDIVRKDTINRKNTCPSVLREWYKVGKCKECKYAVPLHEGSEGWKRLIIQCDKSRLVVLPDDSCPDWAERGNDD